jgi:autotransporter-associated beta strand protein
MNIYGSNLTLGAAGYTGGITVNGAISLGNDTSGSNDRTITIASGTSHSFGGVVSGNTSNKLIKAGAGSLTLANNNTFNAGVQLNEGTLLVGHNNALGTGLMQVQFDIAGTKTLASSSSAAYTLNNNINIYNDLTLGQTSGGTGSLTLGGTIQLGNEANQNRAITVNGSHTISGSIQGARGIVKQGGGTLRLSGINTSTGQIYIDDGIIDLNGGSLGNGTIEIGAGTGGAANATLRVTSGSFSRGITVNSDASAGNRTIDFANTTGTATLSGTVALEKTAEVSVANGGTGLLSGVVSGAGGLTKSGAGNLEVSNANTFDGNVIINGGKVKMSHATALGDTGTITVNAGADLEVAGGITVARNLTLSAVNGAIRGGRLMSSGANEKNTYSGTVAVNNSEFDVASGNTLDVTGKISGTGTVTKTGAGELQLSNTGNDYSGITDAQNGTLTASSITNSGTASAIGTGSEVKVGSASTAGTFKYTGSSASMNRTVTVGSAGGTINVNDAAATMTLAGTLAGSGATLTKTGSGKLALGSGSSTTVSTIAIQQGTLLLGASNQIDNSTAITLSGGTLALDGKTDTVGRLTVSANSIFDFGTAGGSATSFTFSDFNTSAYGSNSFVMTINNAVAGSSIVFNTNYEGNTTFNSFASKIQYGTSGQFGQISFGTGTTTLLVAIPDARVYSAAVALIFLIGIAEVRRRRKCAQRAV